ncbi:peroxidase family protein, partial [Microvirga subterranea]
MVNLVRHDLEFILKQIKIAEAHSAGTPLTEIRVDAQGNITNDPNAPLAISTPLSPYGLRTVDGSYNNLVAGREEWGASDTPFPQITDPYWRNEGDDQIVFGTPQNPVPLNNNNYGTLGSVVDADPRLVSNLIVDQTLDNPAAIYAALTYAGVTGAALMPALNEIRAAKAALDSATGSDVAAAKAILDAALVKHGVVVENGSVVIPNVSPDEGLSAQYNGWFTLFGQFFDHGLDLVPKGGNGTIYIPLQPDDPLYNPNSPHTNFMVLTRAPANPNNLTTPWVDQNQTYSSHSSKQLFMREYAMVDGKPLATGRLLEGDKGLATWADVKEQARTKLGIDLTDADVTNIPLFVMDEYGEFVRGPNGYPQMVTSLGADGKFGGGDDVFVEGNPLAPISTTNAIRTGHAFLDDIAHAAAPVVVGGILQQDSDTAVGYKNADGSAGPVNERGSQTAYDNELLDAHYITGDGRGNENIGLTAVHHIFHSEHNHMVDQVKARAIESGDLSFLNEWLLVDLPAGAQLPDPTNAAAVKAFASTLAWDGERLFQAARFTTEMQYQHLVFEEFARKIQPDVDAFVFNPSMDINPAIFAEFAHVVYRFGHSMLREEVAATNADGSDASMDLFQAFLNPLAFGADGLDHAAAAGAIVRGMTNQIGNEIDEFVTDVLRNQLLGIPLDLAALNIARGRDTGIPPLNEARRQFKEIANGDSQLDPYTSWTDFALNLKNPASIVNFIAAYGTHSTITSASSLEAKREAAWKLVFGGEGAPSDRLDFLNATGAYAGGKLGGLEDIDLWVGGMAEKKMAFGGMLGSTFSFIFELQLENLQNADRFYYLSRVQGLNFLNELENNSFAKMVLNNTDLAETGYAVAGDIFSTPDHILYMDHAQQNRFGYEDPIQDDPWLQAVSPMVERRDANGNLINPEDNPIAIARYIRVNTNDHVLIQGTNGDDTIIAGGGDDSVWGRDGNDRIEAGYGVDRIHGGKGDDIITNSGTDIGEVDMLHGEEGNDVIHAGSGLALVFGNEGQDFIITGPDGKEAFGGTGNDFILGGDGGDFLLGNEGDDWIEAGNGFDTTAGDNSELNFNSTIIGHDVMFAGQNEHDFDAESGDDIMVQGESVMRNEGMFGYDWAIHKGNQEAADSDLLTPIFTTVEQDILRDRFDQVEALSGWKNNDILRGDNRGDQNAETPPPGANGDAVETVFTNNELSQAGVDRVTGLRALLGDWVAAAPATGDLEKVVAFDDGNILLGGGGSDVIQGRGGNDLIDGDRWLNVRIRITVGNETYTADGMAQKVYREADYKDGAPVPNAAAQFGGRTLDALMLDRTLNPGQLSIVREIVADDGVGDTDIAVYGDVRANYTISQNADGSIRISHDTVTAGLVSDGVDKLFNIEKIRFADGEIALSPPKLTLHAFDAGSYGDQFNQSSYANSNGSTPWTTSWQETSDPTANPATSGAIRITGGDLRLGENGGDGASIQRSLDLAGATTARLSYSVSEQGLDPGEQVTVFFSADGITFTLVDTITGVTGNANRSIDLTGPFTANATVRFVTTAMGFNEFVNIDDVAVSFTKPAAAPTVNHETTFTEDGAPVAIASNPGITDDTAQLSSARIVLTNAKAGDELLVGTLPAGITRVIDTSVTGQIIVTLTGAASLAAYQAAIQSVSFRNTSQQPDVQDRIVQVSVNDGFLNSNIATTIVNVAAVNDAPSANNDSVFTNYTTTPFILPEWVLLANDTDADGSPLDITAVALPNNSGLTSVSLATNPGSVTVTDNATGGGTFTYTANDGSGAANATDTATVTINRDTTGTLEGNNGDNILIGDGGNTTLAGGRGDDLIFAGAGNDTVTWGVTTFLGFEIANDGRDYVDGGAGNLDRFVVTGSNAAETFVVYARASVPAALAAGLRPDTEIVITRNGTVIAELDNIEEITINTSGGADTVQAVGNFNPTSLNFNTITVNGDGGDDTVDISALQSAHRIVFRSNGGHDTIVGTLRQQDVVELAPGRTVGDYTRTVNANGTITLASDTHSITYRCEEAQEPMIRECADDDDMHHSPSGRPVAGDDTFTLKKGGVLNLTVADLLANDSDPDGDALCVVAVDEDEHGEVVLNDDGTLTFTPRAGFTGTASFTYRVEDGNGGHDEGRVTIVVSEETSNPAQPPVTQPPAEQPPVVTPPVAEQPGPAAPVAPQDLALRGGRGHDRLAGGDGHDRLYGEKGNDRLVGGDGSDRLWGHDGHDRLDGGAGADHMWGGRGNDTYDVDDRADRVYEGRNQGT